MATGRSITSAKAATGGLGHFSAGVKVKDQARHKEEVEIPSKAQLQAIVAAAKAHPDPLAHPYIATALATGLRPSELRGLRWADVQLKGRNPQIKVHRRADEFGQIGSLKTKAAIGADRPDPGGHPEGVAAGMPP